MHEQLSPYFIRLLPFILILAVGGCGSHRSSDPNCTKPFLACEHEQQVLEGIERLFSTARAHPVGPPPDGYSDLAAEGCWQFFQREVNSSTPPEVRIVFNAADTPYPFRDVMDVTVEVEASDGHQAVLWFYAGGINHCFIR
ncbi:hypothetical protein HC928_12705 [bacterium]|nr:hypothetical protein [bacterium]